MRNKRPHPTLTPLEPRRLFSTTLTLSNPTPDESDKFATFDLTLSSPLAKPLTLTYATQPLTATPGKDYTPKSGSLTLPASSTTATIKIPLLDDNHIESNESFRLLLSSLPPGVKLAKPFATATITDDEPVPGFILSHATVNEGSDPKSPRTATVTVSLFTLGPRLTSDVPLTFHYKTTDAAGHFGSATAKADYTPVKGTLTFRPGQTKQTISIPIRPDKTAEGDESFSITCTEATGAIAPAPFAVTIKDDDAPTGLPVIQVPTVDPRTSAPLLFYFANDADFTTAFALSIPAPLDHDATVDYAFPAGPTGILPAAGTLTIPAGQTSADLQVTALNASSPATIGASPADSTFPLILSNPHGLSLPGGVQSLQYDLHALFQRSQILLSRGGIITANDYPILDRSNAIFSNVQVADFNYDGVIDSADFALMDHSFAITNIGTNNYSSINSTVLISSGAGALTVTNGSLYGSAAYPYLGQISLAQAGTNNVTLAGGTLTIATGATSLTNAGAGSLTLSSGFTPSVGGTLHVATGQVTVTAGAVTLYPPTDPATFSGTLITTPDTSSLQLLSNTPGLIVLTQDLPSDPPASESQDAANT